MRIRRLSASGSIELGDQFSGRITGSDCFEISVYTYESPLDAVTVRCVVGRETFTRAGENRKQILGQLIGFLARELNR